MTDYAGRTVCLHSLHDGSNDRIESYSGSFENRSRFRFEVVSAVQCGWKEAAGMSNPLTENVGLRLAPYGNFYNMFDSN